MRGNIPTFIHTSDGKLGDVNVLDILIPKSGVCYVMDRGYLNFARFHEDTKRTDRLEFIAAFTLSRTRSWRRGSDH